MGRPDVAVIGGGIIGAAAAAFLAEAGASVRLYERTEIGAGASGRNSGAVQHPFDEILYRLHAGSLAEYRILSGADLDFSFPPVPAGLLLLTDDLVAAHRRRDQLARDFPELAPVIVDESRLRAEEPLLANGWLAIHLTTGYPLPPHAAVRAFAERARGAGAEIRIGPAARPVIERRQAVGVALDDGSRVPADAVLIAAGPWTPELVDPAGGWRPLVTTYGVTVQLSLATPPRHILEEGVVHTVNQPLESTPEHAEERAEPETVFSLVSIGEVSTLGSTFLPVPPVPEKVGSLLVSRGARFVPVLGDAPAGVARVCARPQSLDGLPLLGSVPNVEALFIAAGHGPWGISTGPASARLVADLILGRPASIAPQLSPARFGHPRP